MDSQGMEHIIPVIERMVKNFKLNLEKDRKMLEGLPMGQEMLENFQRVVSEYESEPDKNKSALKVVDQGIKYLKEKSSVEVNLGLHAVRFFLETTDFLNGKEISDDFETLASILIDLSEEEEDVC